MAYQHIPNVRIAGISAGVPKQVINNLTTEHRFSKEYDNKAFVELTGVTERRVDDNLTTSDLGFPAAKKLLEELNWNPKEVEALIFVSQTPDYLCPAAACIMQDRLGISKECFAEDIELGCSGWVYGLGTISSLLQNGDMKKALLIAGDARLQYKGSKYLSPLFGHATTVTAIEYEKGADGFFFHYGTDGSGYDAIIINDGGSRNQITESSFIEEEIDGNITVPICSRMKGMDVFAFGISTAPKSIKKLGEHYGFNYLDADYFIFHQANLKMNQTINKKLKLDENKVPMSMTHYGNTSSASIPLTVVTEIRDTVRNGRHKFIGCGFGIGLSWGTVYFELDNPVIPDLIEVDSDEHML